MGEYPTRTLTKWSVPGGYAGGLPSEVVPVYRSDEVDAIVVELEDRISTLLDQQPTETPPAAQEDPDGVFPVSDPTGAGVAFEEACEAFRLAGFTGIYQHGDQQWVVCRRCGAWLMLPPEEVPTDEFYSFPTTWVQRHQIEAHELDLWGPEDGEVPARFHRYCRTGRSGKACPGHPHVWTKDEQHHFCPARKPAPGDTLLGPSEEER